VRRRLPAGSQLGLELGAVLGQKAEHRPGRRFSYFEKFTSFYKDIEFPIFYVQKFIDSHL